MLWFHLKFREILSLSSSSYPHFSKVQGVFLFIFSAPLFNIRSPLIVGFLWNLTIPLKKLLNKRLNYEIEH
jgi:hypothetical protein